MMNIQEYPMEYKTDNLAEALTAGLLNPLDPEIYRPPLEVEEAPYGGISFHIMRLARTFMICTDENFFIGRSLEEHPLKPMLNLENLDGLGTISSVSRRHAMV